MNNTRTDFGVLYGQKTSGDDLLIYSSYQDAKSSPKMGDFIVLAPKNEDGVKFLARVEAEVYDEDPIFRSQDKTLIAVHYARIAERELSERDKQKMFSYTYRVKMLGTFTQDGHGIKFTTAVRKLPSVSYHARHLNPQEVQEIINASEANGAAIGNICIGEDIQADKGAVLFKVDRLRKRRTMVFAQSGFGKTNLVKVLLYNIIGNNSYGKLIFDLNGEYFLKGTDTQGLGDIDEDKIRDNLVVYTDKVVTPEYQKHFKYAGKVHLNMKKNLSVGDILNFGTGFSSVMQNFLYYLDEEGVEGFIENIDAYASDPARLHRDFSDFFGKNEDNKKTGATTTIAAIKKRIKPLIENGKGLHEDSSKLVDDVFAYLKQGKTVIIDLSLKDSRQASIISTILVRKLFELNKEKFTSDETDSVVETVIFVEEAQNVLSDEMVKTNANPFVRCAKEGRKFGIGMVTITQRPSAISEEIRTQAENFFAFHMGNSDDIRALVKSNIQYDGVISNFIQKETIQGNLYLVTSEKAFAVPLRVFEFEKLVQSKLYKKA